MGTRTTAVWVPDWPVTAAVTAAGLPVHAPAAVHDGRRVTAVSAAARAEGVRRGMGRRQARGCCPGLELLPADDGRDVRLFEPVAVAAETVVAGIEVARPGLLLVGGGGASRYHGSEEALAVRLVDAVAAATGHECGVGTGDGLLAAVLAARTGAIVEPGASAVFLAGHGVGELVHAAVSDEQVAAVIELVDLLHRLGLRTLGALAALPPGDVHARFGRLGTWAHTLARGSDERPPARRRPEADLEVAADLDPPVDRVDTATFAGRRLAEQLVAELVRRGAAYGRLQITARTDEGADLVRTWRTDLGGGLTPARITDRVRWQLEGWLTASTVATARDRGADRGADLGRPVTLVRLVLTALDVAPAGAEQPGLWGGPTGGDLRAHRTLERVQGIVGGDGVLAAAVQGGRDVREQVWLHPWGEHGAPPRRLDLPWPGRLPAPAPATVPPEPVPVRVQDPAGQEVRVDPRTALSGTPADVVWVGPAEEAVRIVGWAGPWPQAGRWWAGRPQVRSHLQVALDDGRGLLLAHGPDGWTCEAVYD